MILLDSYAEVLYHSYILIVRKIMTGIYIQSSLLDSQLVKLHLIEKEQIYYLSDFTCGTCEELTVKCA
jgi:hypothetical protein